MLRRIHQVSMVLILSLGTGCHTSSTDKEGTRPAPPTGVSAKAGNAAATISWTAPTNTGGHPLTGYTITSAPGGFTRTVSASTTSAPLSGLTNGTPYTFTVVATNVLGDSPPSAPSNAVTPANVPDAPTGVTATASNGQAEVSWTAPTNDGGSAVTRYTVTPSPSGTPVTVTAPTTRATLTGLTNGSVFTFTVVAINAVGQSVPSSASAPVTPMNGALALHPPKAFASGDNAMTLTFTLHDANGNPLPDQPVSLSSNEPTDVFATPSGITDAEGIFRTTVTGTAVGARTFEARASSDAFDVPGAFIPGCTGIDFILPDAGSPFVYANDVTSGDFDGDGELDLAAVVNGPDVAILPGNGDGEFQPIRFADAGTTQYFLTSGDLDGDDRADLATTSSADDTVSVLLGNGSGSFLEPTAYAVGTRPASVAIGDFDGDGKPDLVTANAGSGNVSVLLGNGNGTFGAARNLDAGTAPESVVTADFNRDGKLDLATAGGTGVSVLLGNGDGTFRAELDSAGGSSPTSLATGDFDGDGTLDIALGGNDVSILHGRGDGRFQPTVSYSHHADGVMTWDMNGDGKLDLVVSVIDLKPPMVGVLLGQGDGTFSSPSTYSIRATPLAATIGDFNDDGKPDLAVISSSTNTVSVLLNSCR